MPDPQMDAARREINALSYITTKLDGLPVAGVLRVLSWARSSNAGSAEGNVELNAMRAVATRLADSAPVERGRILRWLEEHYLADDAEPGTIVEQIADPAAGADGPAA